MFQFRPGLTPGRPIDTVIFDVDGVLIDDTASYYETVMAVVAYIAGDLHGRPAHQWRIDLDVILAFKAAGGFNDDWTLTYTLCGIVLAWAQDCRPPFEEIAAESAGRGMPWMKERFFPGLELQPQQVTDICLEFYWGCDLLESLWGRQAIHNTGPGFVHREQPLIPAGFFQSLGALGIQQMGIITGRSTIELQAGMEVLGLGPSHPFSFVLDSTHIRKPDPRALSMAMDALHPQSALFLGDTMDDLQLVLNYRQSAGNPVPCLAAMVDRHGGGDRFLSAGADLILGETAELLAALSGWNAEGLH